MRFPGLKQTTAESPTVADERRQTTLEPTPEQLRYAAVLEKGALLGLLCLFTTFSLYMLGVLQPHIPVEKTCELWKLDAQQFRAEAKIEAGWGWVSLLGCGDYINFVGITFLAGVTILCYLATVPVLFRRKDFLYIVLALLQVAVLIFAASGVVAVGH